MQKVQDKIDNVRKIRNENSFELTTEVFMSSLNILSTYFNLIEDRVKRGKCTRSILSIEDAHREYVYPKSNQLSKALDILSSNLYGFQDVEIQDVNITYPTRYLDNREY